VKLLAPLTFCTSIAVPALVGADAFSDFKVPAHSTRFGSAELSASGDWLDDNSSGTTTEVNHTDSRLRSRFGFEHDSDPLQYRVDLSIRGRADGHSTTNDQHRFNFQMNEADRGEVFEESWDLSSSVRAYPWRRPLGMELLAHGNGSYVQEWLRQSSFMTGSPPGVHQETRRSDQGHRHIHRAFLQGQIGYGRVRDATVVYDVHVLAERLLSTRAISGPLSDQARERLAELFFVGGDYHLAHERSERYFWQDVETILRDAGALSKDSLDPYSTLLITEPYGPLQQSRGYQRRRGWFAGPVVIASHVRSGNDYDSSFEQQDFFADSLVNFTQQSVSGKTTNSFDQFQLGGRVEYHVPLGWDWQLDAVSEVTVPMRPDEHGLTAGSAARVVWFIADRWRADAWIDHLRMIFEPRDSDVVQESWDVDFGSGLAYFLEDRTNLFVQVGQQQSESHVQYWDGFRRDTQARLGVSYRFLGALEAPGLIEPLRLGR
jgi:hypothetical protein